VCAHAAAHACVCKWVECPTGMQARRIPCRPATLRREA
jgi:hypothetical protein